MHKFDKEAAEVHERVAEMAALTQKMVSLVTNAVKDRTKNVSDEIAECEKQLDAMQVEIDHEAVRLLTVYGPVAADLRRTLVVPHVTSQLERIGDQTVNICESLELMQTPPEHGILSEIPKMADMVREMVDDALSAFFDEDAERAETTRAHDDLIDTLNAQTVKKLLSDELLREVLNGTQDIADALAQILISRQLERIADQAVNICKEVVYMIHGEDVRHRHAEG